LNRCPWTIQSTEFTDVDLTLVLLGLMYAAHVSDQRLEVGTYGVDISIPRAQDACVLPIGSVALDDEPVSHVKCAFLGDFTLEPGLLEPDFVLLDDLPDVVGVEPEAGMACRTASVTAKLECWMQWLPGSLQILRVRAV